MSQDYPDTYGYARSFYDNVQGLRQQGHVNNDNQRMWQNFSQGLPTVHVSTSQPQINYVVVSQASVPVVYVPTGPIYPTAVRVQYGMGAGWW